MFKQIIAGAAALGIAAVSVLALYDWKFRHDGGMQEAADSPSLLYYRSPMNPSVTSPTPTKDEMGMDYIPVYAPICGAPPADSTGDAVFIRSSVSNNLGIQLVKAEKQVLPRHVVGNGIVQYNEDSTSRLHLAGGGWVQRLYVRSEGIHVREGDQLMEIVSPGLMKAQETYLEALQTKQAGNAQQALDQLIALGFPHSLLPAIQASRMPERSIPIITPQAGVIAKVGAAEGVNVAPYSEVMIVTDSSSVWVLANVPERYADWISEGQPATVVRAQARADIATGRVAYVFPGLDPTTRTLKLRLLVTNPDGMLRFDAPVTINVDAGEAEAALVVPKTAVLQGPDGDRVILALGDGYFRPQLVKASDDSGDWVQILAGLNEGDVVVAKGQFLIDSESSMQATLAAYDATAGARPAPGRPPGMVVAQAGAADTQASSAQTVNATATVVAVRSDAVILAHAPIAALHWPAMTMDFKVAQPDLLNHVAVGQRVRFTFITKGMDDLLLTAIDPLADPAPADAAMGAMPTMSHH